MSARKPMLSSSEALRWYCRLKVLWGPQALPSGHCHPCLTQWTPFGKAKRGRVLPAQWSPSTDQQKPQHHALTRVLVKYPVCSCNDGGIQCRLAHASQALEHSSEAGAECHRTAAASHNRGCAADAKPARSLVQQQATRTSTMSAQTRCMCTSTERARTGRAGARSRGRRRAPLRARRR